jgi:DNA (cytosine-5)-methyltransferase 1
MVPTGTQEALAERAEPGRRDEAWHRADVVCGGFPCQDISNAGGRAGITGLRSDLWRWLCGAIRMVRPSYAIVENVAALLDRGMGTVLGDLAEIGYDAEWHCIPASAVGAEHDRDRIWIVADPMREGLSLGSQAGENGQDARILAPRLGSAVRAAGEGLERRGASRWSGDVHGIPGRVDRIRALGNAVYPAIPEAIGRAMMHRIGENKVAACFSDQENRSQPVGSP